MSTPNTPARRIFDLPEDDIVRYRGVSLLAVFGLIVGLLSPMALLGLMMWPLPVAAIVVNVWALRQIAARAPELIGRKAALLGLFVALASAAAAPAEYVLYSHFLRQEAKQFAAEWFELIRSGEGQKAHDLTIAPKHRRPLDDSLWNFYRQNESWQRQLKIFVNQPVMRTLLALGKDAEIRYYETANEAQLDGGDTEQLTFAVTYNDAQEGKTSFFVTVLMQRTLQPNGHAAWTVIHIDGGVRPPGW